jgi:hypothetical protein
MNNTTAHIIENNPTVKALWIKCAQARNNYNSYQPREYNNDAILMIAHLESEYNNAVKAYQKALKAAKANA